MYIFAKVRYAVMTNIPYEPAEVNTFVIISIVIDSYIIFYELFYIDMTLTYYMIYMCVYIYIYIYMYLLFTSHTSPPRSAGTTCLTLPV